jgi:hypothetical protein
LLAAQVGVRANRRPVDSQKIAYDVIHEELLGGSIVQAPVHPAFIVRNLWRDYLAYLGRLVAALFVLLQAPSRERPVGAERQRLTSP